MVVHIKIISLIIIDTMIADDNPNIDKNWMVESTNAMNDMQIILHQNESVSLDNIPRNSLTGFNSYTRSDKKMAEVDYLNQKPQIFSS